MTKSEIKEFKGFVRDTLMREYKMNELEAYRAVQDSYLSEALQRDSDYVEHDTVEEWAEFIFNEVSQRVLLRM
jgi:hypothetical protein